MSEVVREMTCSPFMQKCSKRLATIVVVILSILLVMVIQQTNFENSLAEPQPWTMKSSYFQRKVDHEKEVDKNDGDKNVIWNLNQLERIKTFREKCQMYHLNTERRSNLHSFEEVIYTEQFKLAFRPIPKVGSTFMKRVIFLLSDIENEHVFDLARSDVHDIKKSEIRKPLTVENLKGYTVLIIIRNPYSRIYSAYIDKVYILSSFPLCIDIYSKLSFRNNRTRSCNFNISFENFLDYLLHANETVLSDHYDPIMSLSYGKQVCNLKDIQIVKQETFSEDIDHALKSVNVSGKVYDVIYEELYSKHTESTIRSIVKTVYKKFSADIQNNSCLTWKDMAIKLWKSFQIQGYIHKNSKFPGTKLDRKADYMDLIEVIMKELGKRPLKHEEQVHQRNTALLKAYAGVNKEYIREIQERYAMDFDMFHYNTDFKLSVS